MYYNDLRRSKLQNFTERKQYLIYDNHKITIFHLLNYIYPLSSKLHGKMKQKLALLWSKINAKIEFSLSHLMATYHSSLCRYCRLWSLYALPHLKNRFVESNCLCQRIKHCFVVCISFWRVQNCYKEMDVIRSLFYWCIECNLHRVHCIKCPNFT